MQIRRSILISSARRAHHIRWLTILRACSSRALGCRIANDALKCVTANLGDLNAGCQANCSDINLSHVFCVMWIWSGEATEPSVVCTGLGSYGGLCSGMLPMAKWGPWSSALLWKCYVVIMICGYNVVIMIMTSYNESISAFTTPSLG